MQNYSWPSVSVSATNPSVGVNSAPIPSSATLVGAENPSGDLRPLQVDGSDNLLVSVSNFPASPSDVTIVGPLGPQSVANSVATTDSTIVSRLGGSLTPAAFDEVNLTYVTVGNGIGQIETAVYKLATVTVKTLNLTYDANDRLSSVVAS